MSKPNLCGVICEFDPFHNGHARLLRLLREETGCDGIVCVMSGAFTQRGEAAIVSKWARAEMALHCGADFVFELPALFAVRDAAHFALGGVSLLHSLGVSVLGFGSESGEIEPLAQAAAMDIDPDALREGLRRGESFARARGAAFAPNDTLGIEYLRAIRKIGSGMQPVTIRREGGGYHDGEMGPLASATAIRGALWSGKTVAGAMPEKAQEVMEREIADGGFQRREGLDSVLLAALRLMSLDSLADVPEVGEGLENRLQRAAQQCGSREEALCAVKCKRYTRARLSRAMTQAMLGMSRKLTDRITEPPYARLLGFRRDAVSMLHEISRQATVPVETRGSRLRETGGETFAVEMRASDLWALGCERRREACRDLTEKMLVV